MSSTAATHITPRLAARATRPGAADVAAMLDTLAAADRQLADALDSIAGSRARVSRSTVTVLERLLAALRPAADVRACLARVDRHVLAAAIRLRREHYGDPAVTTTSPSLVEKLTDDQH